MSSATGSASSGTTSTGLVSTASVTVNAPSAKVWQALTDPAAVKQYMFGTDVSSDWQKGSPITWKGEYEGKKYEDKGTILKVEPERVLQYSHFSPLTGKPDVPENYHTVTIELAPQDSQGGQDAQGSATQVTLSQDNNPDEEARQQTAKNWQGMLESLKKVVEGDG